MTGPDDVLVDDWEARSKKSRWTAPIACWITISTWPASSSTARARASSFRSPTLQELSGAHDKASIFFLKCTRADHTAAVMDEMRAILPGYEIRPLKDFLSLMTSTSLPGLDAFVDSMIALAVAIGFLVIFLSMYTTVIERTRDIGVLKSMGASNAYIIRALLMETAAHLRRRHRGWASP